MYYMPFKNNFLIFCFLLFLFCENNIILGQSTPDPCSFVKIRCGEGQRNTLFNSFFSDSIFYASPGSSMPFWFAFGDSATGIIDTTGSYNFSLSKLSGPGNIMGNSGTITGYYSYLSDVSFSEVGNYKVLVNVGGFPGSFVGELIFTVPPEEDFCNDPLFQGCVNGGGNQILAQPQFSNVVPVDEVMPVKVGVVDSTTGSLDSSFSGTIYVDQVDGPGELYGALSMTGAGWFHFNNLRFSKPGSYSIRFFSEDSSLYKDALVGVEVVQTANTSLILNLDNLMVYPNPFQDRITLSSDYDLKGIDVELLNFSGQKVLKKDISESSQRLVLNVDHLRKGVYFLIMSETNKSANKILKIVK